MKSGSSTLDLNHSKYISKKDDRTRSASPKKFRSARLNSADRTRSRLKTENDLSSALDSSAIATDKAPAPSTATPAISSQNKVFIFSVWNNDFIHTLGSFEGEEVPIQDENSKKIKALISRVVNYNPLTNDAYKKLLDDVKIELLVILGVYKKEGSAPNGYAISNALILLGLCGESSLGDAISQLAFLASINKCFTNCVLNMAIKSFGQCGIAERGAAIYKAHSHLIDVQTHTMMLTALGTKVTLSNKLNRRNEIYRIYQIAISDKSESKKANVLTLNAAMRSLEECGDPSTAIQFYENSSLRNEITYKLAINCYVLLGEDAKGKKLFDEQKIEIENLGDPADSIFDFHGHNYGTAYLGLLSLFNTNVFQSSYITLICGQGLHSKHIDLGDHPVLRAIKDIAEKLHLDSQLDADNEGRIFIEVPKIARPATPLTPITPVSFTSLCSVTSFSSNDSQDEDITPMARSLSDTSGFFTPKSISSTTSITKGLNAAPVTSRKSRFTDINDQTETLKRADSDITVISTQAASVARTDSDSSAITVRSETPINFVLNIMN